MAFFKKIKAKLKRSDKERTSSTASDPPQLIHYDQSQSSTDFPTRASNFSQKPTRALSNVDSMIKRPEQLASAPGSAPPRNNQTIYHKGSGRGAPINLATADDSTNQHTMLQRDHQKPPPPRQSFQRAINTDLITSSMMAEREKESSEESPQEYQNDGTIAAVETTQNMDSFNDLAASHRPKQISPLTVGRFDVVKSPALPKEESKGPRASETLRQMQDHGFAVNNDGDEGDFFDQGRQRNSKNPRTNWRDQPAAAEDSDEDLLPLATIIPDHLKVAADHEAAKPQQNSLQQQMAGLIMDGESEDESEGIDSDSDRPSSQNISKKLSSNKLASSLKPKRDNASVPVLSYKAKKVDFSQSLMETNLAAVEEPTSTNESNKDARSTLEDFDSMNTNKAMLNKSEALQSQDTFTRISKRKTLNMDKLAGEANVRASRGLDNGRAAIYKKRSAFEDEDEKPYKADYEKEIEVAHVDEQVPSEKSYDSESELDLDAELAEVEQLEEKKRLAAENGQIVVQDMVVSSAAGVGANFLKDLLEANFDEDSQISNDLDEEKSKENEGNCHDTSRMSTTEDESDLIQLIEQSEHAFIRFAQQKLVDNRIMIQERAAKALEGLRRKEVIEQRVLSEVCQRNYGLHEAKFINQRRSERDTCIAISDEVVVIGTQQGTLNCYNRETCRPYGRFHDSSPEFENNPVTCMNIHPLRTEYLVIGFQGGQFMIIDLSQLDKNNMLKPKKVVKDHHKGQPIVSIKFCDWLREREVSEESKGAPNTQDTQAWMIATVDLEGRVIISCVRDLALGILKASKFIILDPRKQTDALVENPRFSVLEPRFYNVLQPQGEFNDTQTWLALANRSEVQILQVTKETCKSCFSMKKPTMYASERVQKFLPFPETLPVMAWGYGRSPLYKHRTQSMLAVAWGSLIQLVLLIPDDEKMEQGIDFRVDGQYFVAPGKVQDINPRTSVVQDVRIEAMRFLSESILLVYTSTHDIRVLYTQSFHNGEYAEPTKEQLAETDTNSIIDNFDSRLKLLEPNRKLTKEQRSIEMERRQFLSSPLLMSIFGGRATQTLSSFDDWCVFMTEAGYCSVQHMTWQEYVETSELDMDNTWIDKFQRALDIFDGKISGFKGVVADRDLRQESMKAELKLLVTELIDKLISQWKSMAGRMENNGTALNEVFEHFQAKHRVLIKRSIEMCVDIWEPFFLFNELFQKFNDSGLSQLFADELKPYILSGKFSDTDMPESILVHHVLKQPQERFKEQENAKHNGSSPSSGELTSSESPAESLEKIIVNLSFKHCTPDFQHNLLNFCKQKKLTTAHFYLAVNYTGSSGIVVALHQMRTFYLQFKEEERMVVQSNRQPIERKDLISIQGLSADLPYREVIERSAIYTGYKLLWVIRLTLLGKRFPSGHYEMRLWQDIVHEILDLITHEEFMKILFEIDASAFFQIITIAFNNPSVQYDFLLNGRNNNVNLMEELRTSMTHAELIKRISDYCLLQLPEGSEVRLQYLFFIASIADEDQETRDQNFYYKVTLELIAHHSQFMMFNRSLLQRQMTQKQMYRKLSRRGLDAPDKVKHVVLSEESIMALVRKCEPLAKEQINVLVESIEHTSFESVKLMLFEKQEYYDKCLKLLVECESVSNFITVKMRDRFAWIIQTYFMLESRLGKRNENTHDRFQVDQFEKKIFEFAHSLTALDSHKAVGLIDCLFKDKVSQHLAFMNRMKDHPHEQYMYTSKVLEIKGERAKSIMIKYSVDKEVAAEAEDWLTILNKDLELACRLEPDSVVKKIKANIKQNFYPADECLAICRKYELTEACAILCKNVGNYKEAVQYYIELVNKTINTPKNILLFKGELYNLDKHIRVTVHKQKKLQEKKEMERYRQQHQNMRSTVNDLDLGLFQQQLDRDTGEINSVIQSSHSDLVPTTYTKNFSMKEKFVDAIQLKLFIQQNCPNICLLERVLKLLSKLIKGHPEELLKTNEQIWLLIIKMMFGLTQHQEMHRKRYCRRFLIVKMVSLVREMLKYMKLKSIIDGILQNYQTIKFRAVKQLIYDVFWDKRVEVELCMKAHTISFSELREHQNEYIDHKGDGLSFRYTRCDICRLNMNQTSRNFVANVNAWGKQDDALLIIFDCSKESSFNHAFHERCLKNYIEEEMSKDKKANMAKFDIFKVARCIVCYKSNQDIGNTTQQSTARARIQQQRAGRATPRTHRGAPEGSDQSSETHSQSSGARNQVRRTIGSSGQTMEELQQVRLQQKIKLFEKEMGSDTLTCENFANVD